MILNYQIIILKNIAFLLNGVAKLGHHHPHYDFIFNSLGLTKTLKKMKELLIPRRLHLLVFIHNYYSVLGFSINFPLGSFLKFHTCTAWKLSKYRVFSGSYFPVFGMNTGNHEPEKTPYLDTFDVVLVLLMDVHLKAHKIRVIKQIIEDTLRYKRLTQDKCSKHLFSSLSGFCYKSLYEMTGKVLLYKNL